MQHSIVPFARTMKQYNLSVGLAFYVNADSIGQAIDKISNLLSKLDEFETSDCQCYCHDYHDNFKDS